MEEQKPIAEYGLFWWPHKNRQQHHITQLVVASEKMDENTSLTKYPQNTTLNSQQINTNPLVSFIDDIHALRGNSFQVEVTPCVEWANYIVNHNIHFWLFLLYLCRRWLTDGLCDIVRAGRRRFTVDVSAAGKVVSAGEMTKMTDSTDYSLSDWTLLRSCQTHVTHSCTSTMTHQDRRLNQSVSQSNI